jgi:hypothetical protein
MTKTHTYSIASAVLISLLVAGCGGGGDAGTPAAAPATNTGTGSTGTGTSGTDTTGTGTTGTGTTGTGTTGTGTTGTGTTGTGTTGTGTTGTGTLTYAPGIQAGFLGRAVMVGKNNTLFGISSTANIIQSLNGSDWTDQVASGITAGTGIRSAKFVNNKYVAVGQNVSISDSATSWTNFAATTTWPEPIRDVAGNGAAAFVAVGLPIPSATPARAPFLFSSDGTTWTPLNPNLTTDKEWTGVAFGNNKWVAIGFGVGVGGASGYSATSTDGQTWTQRATSFSPSAATQRLVFSSADNTFIALTNGGSVYTSNDGETWSLPLTADALGRNILRINCHSSGVCIASTASNSSGGPSLVRRNAAGVWGSVAYTSNVGTRPNSYALTSETVVPLIESIAYTGSKWIAVGNNGTVGVFLESTDDGLTWSRKASR